MFGSQSVERAPAEGQNLGGTDLPRAILLIKAVIGEIIDARVFSFRRIEKPQDPAVGTRIRLHSGRPGNKENLTISGMDILNSNQEFRAQYGNVRGTEKYD